MFSIHINPNSYDGCGSNVSLTYTQGDLVIHFQPWRPRLIKKIPSFEDGFFNDAECGLNFDGTSAYDPEDNDGAFVIDWKTYPDFIQYESGVRGDFDRRGTVIGKIPKTPATMSSLKDCFDQWKSAFQTA